MSENPDTSFIDFPKPRNYYSYLPGRSSGDKMIDIVFRGLRWLTLYSLLLWPIPSTFSKNALIFDPETLVVYDRQEKNNPQRGKFPEYAIACPTSKSQYDTAFNRDYSLDNHALLVREVPREEFDARLLSYCADEVALSIAYHVRPDKKIIDIGYDVYYDLADFPDTKFNRLNYANFGKFYKQEFRIMDSEGESVRATVPWKGNSKQMGFVWISKIILKYDEALWNVIRVNFKIYRNINQLTVQCNNYNMGDRMYKGKNIDDLYSITNQEKIFSSVMLPQSQLIGECLSNRRCLVKYNLVPPYVFQPTEAATVSCTNITSVPIWHEVSKLLNYLNDFLFAMAQITEKRLIIIPGTYGTLTLPKTDGNAPKEIFLHSDEKKIPVPKIIYYIVRYRPFPIRDLKKWYDVVIVIHNEPEFSDKDKLCTQDVCQLWGWENVQYLSPTNRKSKKSKHVYCCKFIQTLADKLEVLPGTSEYSDLDLKNFPTHYHKNTGEVDYTDKQIDFETKMAELPSLKEMLQKNPAGKSSKRKEIPKSELPDPLIEENKQDKPKKGLIFYSLSEIPKENVYVKDSSKYR